MRIYSDGSDPVLVEEEETENPLIDLNLGVQEFFPNEEGMIKIYPEMLDPKNYKFIAKNIINKSKVFDHLEPALKNIDYVIATSARFRNKNIKHIQLEDLKKIDFTKKVAFLFGSEASGLSNNEISYANYTLQIPTNPDFKSLNLSHSLIIIAQYVSGIVKSKTSNFKESKKVKAASKKEIHSMTNLCIQNLDEINFFKPTKLEYCTDNAAMIAWQGILQKNKKEKNIDIIQEQNLSEKQ